MAEIYKFFDSTADDARYYQASDFADYFGKVLSTGLLHIDEVPGLKVTNTGADLSVTVSQGGAIIDGHLYENTTAKALSLGLPGSISDRIDRIVLRFDNRSESRYIRLFVKQGESATSPTVPVLQRDNEIYELSLAQIRVRANTSSINPSDILDERLDRQVAGLTFSLISKPHLADIATGSYSATATIDGQKDFVIPYEGFNKDGDGLTVFVDGKKMPTSSYTVFHPRTVSFSAGLPYGTRVDFDVIRGVIILPDDYVFYGSDIGLEDVGGYFNETNVEGALQKIASNEAKLRKEVANLNLQLDASSRVQNATTFGSNWTASFGMTIDFTKKIVANSVAIGTSVLTVDSSAGFAVGQKATLFNRVQSEEVTVVSVTPTSITITPTKKGYIGTVNIARSNVKTDGTFGTTDEVVNSFETGVEGWAVRVTGDRVEATKSGGVSTSWASIGSQSYLLRAEMISSVTAPNQNNSTTAFKSFDLTEVEFISFDINLLGAVISGAPAKSSFSIAGVTKWESNTRPQIIKDITIDVRDQVGIKELSFTALINNSVSAGESGSFHIDNLRFGYATNTADIRFTTKPTDELVMWTEHGPLLSVNAEMNGVPLTKTPVAGESQFIGQKPYSATEVKLSVTRSSTGDKVKINKIIGGVG